MGENEVKKTTAGRKVLMIFGIFFLSVAVFLASFVFSFNFIINASNQEQMDDGSIEAENAKLKEDIQILEDQNKILQAEIDRYTGNSSSRSGSTSRSTSSSTSRSSSSSSSNDDRSSDDSSSDEE